MTTAIVTILGSNYLARASLLRASVEKHHPNWSFFSVVIDVDNASDVEGAAVGQVLLPESLGIDPLDLATMDLLYNITEFSTAVKPFALRRLLDEGFDHVYYLDPDTELLGPLDESEEQLRHHDVVLTPHTLGPIPDDGKEPSQDTIRSCGTFNLGFFGGNRGARSLLDWWARCLVWGAGIEPHRNLFTDQRWMDFAPSFADVFVLKHPGYNVAYWNLHERQLARAGEGLTSNGEPVRLFHYSGYDPNEPWRLSKYTLSRPRVRLADSQILYDVCDSYGRRLVEWSLRNHRRVLLNTTYSRWEMKFLPRLPDSYLHSLRDMLHQEKVRGGTGPRIVDGEDPHTAVERWIMSPSAGVGRGGLPRLALIVWGQRGDLQVAFPDPHGADSEHFWHWWGNSASSELGLPYDLRERVRAATRSEGVRASEGETSASDVGPHTQAVFADSLNVVGYLATESGVGEAGRKLAIALEEGGVDIRRLTSRQTSSRQLDGASTSDSPRRSATVFCVNADQLPAVLSEFPELATNGCPRFAYWWWELEEIPPYFASRAELVDEVWAPTEFIYKNLRRQLGDVVQRAPLLIDPQPHCSSKDKSALGLPTDVPVFMVRFDFLSSMSRKNPQGAVRAFRKAFPRSGEALLLLKSTNGDLQPAALDRLAWSVRDREDIRVWDESLSHEDNNALTASVDCLVSLHRSEGLGLNIAEAMALGTTVIATGYGGNMEFCDDANSILIPHRMVPVSDPTGTYASLGSWAEPDLDSAAQAMRDFVDQPQAAADMVASAREAIRLIGDVGAFAEFAKRRIGVASASQRLKTARSSALEGNVTWQASGVNPSHGSVQMQLPTEVELHLSPMVLPTTSRGIDLLPVEAVLDAGQRGWMRDFVRRIVFKLTEGNLWYARRLAEDITQQQMYVELRGQVIPVRTVVSGNRFGNDDERASEVGDLEDPPSTLHSPRVAVSRIERSRRLRKPQQWANEV